MAKYHVTHSCGCTVTHQLFGRHVDRDRKIEWLESVSCLECKQAEEEKARAVHNQESAEANIASGLPPLSGTEKQIAWSESIRKDMVARLDIVLANLADRMDRVSADKDLYKSMLDQAIGRGFISVEESFFCAEAAIARLKTETAASWWIEHRESDIGQLILDTAVLCRSEKIESIPEAADAISEATIRPQSPITETVAEIRILDNAVEIIFPEKRDDFWQIVKKRLGYEWAGSCWRRKLNSTFHGTPADRAAEAGNQLLASGFVIRIFDEKARKAAIDATYQPECKRWIAAKISGKYAGWFAIEWKGKNDSLYNQARKLMGSRWSKPDVVVPAEQFEMVVDFAEAHGFRLSPGAEELLTKTKAARDAALVARPAAAPITTVPSPGRPDLDPSTAGTIDADLLDD